MEGSLTDPSWARDPRAEQEGPPRRLEGRSAQGSGALTEHLGHLVIRNGARIVRVSSADIDWIEAADYYVELHVGSTTYLHRERMSVLEARLDPHRFVRIHRSIIVALDRIAALLSGSHGAHRVVLRDGTELRLSRSRRRPLRRLFEQAATHASADRFGHHGSSRGGR